MPIPAGVVLVPACGGITMASCEQYHIIVHGKGGHLSLIHISFQNYFRMYKKLSGMTGTAKTEATEFTEIYGLNIVTVPTNRPNIRKDYPDAVYKTVNGKYKAVIEQVLECHKNGQPVLVGTLSLIHI